jgi:hypothetical protein
VLVIGTATWLCGQIAVNPQLTGGARSVNTQVNTQVYGAGPSNSVRYAQQRGTYSQPMNSEWRHAYWKSGALPSDVRMGYAALGPMTPSGPMAYIPPKPSYLDKPAPTAPAPSRPTNFSTNQSTSQSVRYATNASPGAMRSSALPAQMSRPPVHISSALSASTPTNSAMSGGTVRYTR